MNDNDGLPLAVLGFRDYPKSRLQDVWWLITVPFRAFAFAYLLPYPRVLVLEFGAGPGGSITRLAQVAPPTIAVVTAIGPSHLDTFGSIAGIVEEKSALVRAVPPSSGLVVLGADNAHAVNMARFTSAPVVKVPGRGRYLSENIACVFAQYFGLPEYLARRAAAERGSIDRRLETRELPGLTLIVDCYNANPLSMRLGLDTLAESVAPPQRKVAVLGMMAELGRGAADYHREIADYARPRADAVIGVGVLAVHYKPDHHFETSLDCAAHIQELVRPGDCVLIKGSFSVELKHVVWRLEQLAREGRFSSCCAS